MYEEKSPRNLFYQHQNFFPSSYKKKKKVKDLLKWRKQKWQSNFFFLSHFHLGIKHENVSLHYEEKLINFIMKHKIAITMQLKLYFL
jgi:hypothetical protein